MYGKMSTLGRLAFTGLALLACAGTRPAGTPAPAPDRQARADTATFVYECADSYGFVARVEGTTAWVFLPGRTVMLTRVEAASGVKYTNGEITLWTEGDKALLEGVVGKQLECRNNRSRAIWEHAKLNGVDFRATGNEPGWYLEIRNGGTIKIVTDYGQRHLEFPTPVPEEDREQRVTGYRIKTQDHDLTILLEAGRCSDTMSGEQFETTVTVVLDGRKFSGCGRPLH